jgi:hypothetical protein
MRIALVHDYLRQRGGAERVVLSLTRARRPGRCDPGGRPFPQIEATPTMGR